MGTSVRVFVVHDDDTVKRFPTSRYERLTSQGSDFCVKEFAGQRVRFAVAFVELENREPVALRHASFELIKFDEQGRLDRVAHERSLQLAINLLDRGGASDSGGVIDASARFARREFENNHQWRPSDAVLQALAEAAMASPRAKSRRSHLRLVDSRT